MAQTPTTPRNAVLFHHPDSVDTSRPRLLGRHAAGEGFLGGFVRHSGVDAFYGHTLTREHFDDFARRVGAADPYNRPRRWVPLGEMAAAEPATLMVVDPAIAPFAWRRRATGGRGYSLCGVTHTLASDHAMTCLGELVTAPLQPWDALVCTSETARAAVAGVLDHWADYLSRRAGGDVRPLVQLPVIPLGVDCDAFARSPDTEAERVAIRQGLGIGEADIAVLYMGRLSFHAKAHPTPLYLSLEEAARRTARKLHLIQAGWFANETIEREIRSGLRAFAPSVNAIFLDGRESQVRGKVWFAADIFVSLADNIQETFGLAPVEAMAAELPVVVSDWDGYRDTVRPGVDGFTVPTWMPLPQSGGDLALAPEGVLGGELAEQARDQHLGLVSQFTPVDIAAAADAVATLADDDGLRRRMGKAARQHAIDDFDWRVVVAAYQALWRELENIRNRETETAPVARARPAQPLGDDPFAAFAGYPTETVDGDTTVSLVARDGDDGGWRRRLDAIQRQPMNVFAADAMLGRDDLEALLGRLVREGPLSVYALAEMVAEERRYLATRSVAWLAKMGIVALEPAKGRRRKGKRGAEAGGPSSALVDLGIAARARGAFGVAARYFKRALDNQPDDPVANTQYGELMAYAGKLADAQERFRHAASQAPDYHPAHRNLGRALFLDGDYAGAAEALARASGLAPKDAETKYLLGVCCRYSGAADDARRHLEQALEIEDHRVDAVAHLGLVHKNRGDGAAARELFQRVLARDRGHVLAAAALMSLEAEDTGRRLAESNPGAKRVALYVHAKFHLALLRPLFAAFADGHWPHISADLRDLADFGPAVTVVCDAPIARVRALVGGTTTVNARQGLAERVVARRPSDHADYVCVPGPAARDRIVAAGALAADRVWVTGYAPTDPLFGGAAPPPADAPADGRPMVLYAPTHNPAFSSAPILGERVAALIGGRDDVAIVIKPHPYICEFRPGWMAAWGRIAAREPHVHLVRDPAADITPYLLAADALVSDASGVVFQYLALDRPIVLITNPEHTRDAEHYDPDAIEWKWRDVGEEVTDVADLAAAVKRALADPGAGADARARRREELFGDLTDGGSAARIVARIGAL